MSISAQQNNINPTVSITKAAFTDLSSDAGVELAKVLKGLKRGQHRAVFTPELIQEMKTICADKVQELDGFYADQFGSKDVVRGYEPMGIEIAGQIDQKVDLLCASVGTGGALMGTLKGLNASGLFPKTVALEPSQSPLLTTGRGGPHRVEGIGVGFYPPFLDDQKVDAILAIDQDEAFEMRNILAVRHGIFCGTSTGLNVVGAIKLAKKMLPHQNVVTLGCDSGLKYLN